MTSQMVPFPSFRILFYINVENGSIFAPSLSHSLPQPAVCGMRYKTRPGLSYHYNHSHKDGRDKNSSGGGGGGGGGQGPPDMHDEGSLGAQSLTPPSTPDGGEGLEGQGAVVLLSQILPGFLLRCSARPWLRVVGSQVVNSCLDSLYRVSHLLVELGWVYFD